MTAVDAQNPLLGETACGSLLQQLQQIWDEVSQTDEERDKMLLQLEQECLDVYKRKVDQAVKSRAHLLQALADGRIELSRLLSALGDKTYDGTMSDYFSWPIDARKDFWVNQGTTCIYSTNTGKIVETERGQRGRVFGCTITN